MFQTSGYFKGLPCPYFESGLCERPYCHFGHFKSKPSPPTRTGPAGNPAVSGNILQTDYIKVPGKGYYMFYIYWYPRLTGFRYDNVNRQ